jgi:hypothetical protein
MAYSSIYERRPPTDFTGRLPRVAPYADMGMAVDPYADPGNAMPHVTPEEANPARHNYGVERIGGQQNQLMDPNLVSAYHRQQLNALLAGPFDEMADHPKSTARVPQYSMRDTPYYQLIPPITGRETTAPVMSNEARRDADIHRQMAEINQQMAEMRSRPGFNINMLMPLMAQYKALADRSPTMLQTRRNTEARKAVPDDVAAILRGIENAGRR